MGSISPRRRESVERIHIPAWQFQFPSGAAMALAGSRYPGYAFDKDADETVRGQLVIPRHWDKVRVDLLWTNAADSTGNVRWTMNFAMGHIGASLASDFGSAIDMTAAAPGLNVLGRTTMHAGFTLTPAHITHLRVVRRGTHVADTLGNDAILVGVDLTRV